MRMRMGFKPDILPDKLNEHNVVVKGFQSTESKKKDDQEISKFITFFVENFQNPNAQNLIKKRLKELEHEGLGKGQVLEALEVKFAQNAIAEIKKSPLSLFSDLSRIKSVANTLFSLGINKERFGKLLEPEIVPFFAAQAKIISFKNNQQSIDTKNPQVINGVRNLIDLGVSKEAIQDTVK